MTQKAQLNVNASRSRPGDNLVVTVVETLARRDRLLVVAGLTAITALSWFYLLNLASGMSGGMQSMAMPTLEPWSVGDFTLMFVMWAVMMVAMMTPSAAPMILLHAAIIRKRPEPDRPATATAAFTAGYLVLWTGFSALATLLQWALEQAALLSPMMVSTSPYLGGALLIAAGVYQITPLKNACLQHCRSPVHFLTSHWRKGTGGAFRMGLAHGLYCIGCCWVLMALLFVGGVMNLLWIAAIAIFVLMEKITPHGHLISRATGGMLALGGLWLIAQG
jgi:predicted metal-binding membrane protein